MSTASAGLEQLPPDTVLEGSRPVATLGVSAGDLSIDWSSGPDDLGESLVALVRGPDDELFALETYPDAPTAQVTVYGTVAGESLTQLIHQLGLEDEVVLDRVDWEHEEPRSEHELAAAQAVADAARSIDEQVAGISERIEALERDVVGAQAWRKIAAAALQVGEHSEREETVLSLMRDGLSVSEISELLSVTPDTIRRHIRAGTRSIDPGGKISIGAVGSGKVSLGSMESGEIIIGTVGSSGEIVLSKRKRPERQSKRRGRRTSRP
jgi:hypothetical protein